jgi:hypothetical protein
LPAAPLGIGIAHAAGFDIISSDVKLAVDDIL